MHICCLTRCVPHQDLVVSCWKTAPSHSKIMSWGNNTDNLGTLEFLLWQLALVLERDAIIS